ncbi:DUF2059 domain-containing protein [Aquitalea magnusonii]|uniref:DUF2059 domain-containing protein n=1 Tax=Aquitalea magnusonii TaxID=332411 RepID=A0A318JA47_9NEIS|nr:DUF2059 domain-containing protein [Aquitalea magnusonii]PXX46279.1 hypothetical protein DFR38_109121 [Aquitalea magnusonii]
MFAASPIKTAIAAIALTLPMLAHADAAQDAAAKELAQVIGLNNMPNDLANRTTGSAAPLLQEYFVKNKINLTPEQQKKAQDGFKGYADGVHKSAADYFNSPAVKKQFEQEVVKNYSAQFSAAEMQQIVAFYKTPAGQKLMKQQPVVIDGIMKSMLGSAEKTLLPKMRSAAEAYGKSITK